MNITLNVTLDTANACLVALSKFPWEQADPHIKVLREQVEPQVETDIDPATEKAGGTD